jgi:hypothetical protein
MFFFITFISEMLMKMLFRIFWGLTLYLWLMSSTASAQGFQFKNPKKKYARLNFKLYNNLIIIPLLLNNRKDTLNFILDTGVGHTLFIDSTFLKVFGVDSTTRKVSVKGGGVGEIIPTYVVPKQSLQIGGDFIAKNHTILITSQPLEYISQYAGIRVHGITGYDFFQNLVVRINYIRKELDIYEPSYFEQKMLKKNDVTNIFKIYLQRQKPYLVSKIVNEEQDTLTVKLLIDTGAGHSLSLDRNAKKGIRVPKKAIDNSLGMAINGLVVGKMGRIRQLEIGKFVWKDVICSFPDSLLIVHRNESVDKQGSIGIGILERFTVTLDYYHERCILEPNHKFYKKFDMGFSGIEILSDVKDFQKYFVSGIHPLSSAYQSGLQIGDEIFAINNQIASKLNIGQMYELLDSVENKTIQLLIRRQGNLQIVAFKTKRLI